MCSENMFESSVIWWECSGVCLGAFQSDVVTGNLWVCCIEHQPLPLLSTYCVLRTHYTGWTWIQRGNKESLTSLLCPYILDLHTRMQLVSSELAWVLLILPSNADMLIFYSSDNLSEENIFLLDRQKTTDTKPSVCNLWWKVTWICSHSLA